MAAEGSIVTKYNRSYYTYNPAPLEGPATEVLPTILPGPTATKIKT